MHKYAVVHLKAERAFERFEAICQKVAYNSLLCKIVRVEHEW